MASAATIEKPRSFLSYLQVPEFSKESFPDRLYLITNEQDRLKTLQTLAEVQSYGNTFLGTSGLFNLNAASVKQNIEYIVIFDRSDVVRIFWEKLSEIILESNDRTEAERKIIQMVEENNKLFFGKARGAWKF